MAINLALTLTLDGRDAFWNSGNTGTKLDITHLQFGTRNRLPTGEESLLSLPKQSVKIQNGNKIGPDQVRIMATMPGIENYNVTEIGLWSGEPGLVGSILIAYTSVRTGYIAQMVNGIDLVFTYDMVIATTDIDKINIVKDTDQSSTFSLLAEHETDRNAHPFYVTTDTAQTISGAKTFTNKAIFSGGLTGELTGNASTATQLKTPRTIGGVSFNGTANINLPGVDIAGNQNTSGNAATATKLATARSINGVGFDGTANITIADDTKLPLTGGTITGSLNVSDTITVTNVGEQVGAFKKLIQASTTTDGGFIAVGNNGVDKGYVEIGTTDEEDTEIYASQRALIGNTVIRRAKLLDSVGNTSFPGTVTAPTFNGALNGNAASATKLQTARTINGVSFDGTSNITIAAETPSITLINSDATLASATTPGLYSVAGYSIAGLYDYGLLRVWSFGGVWNQMFISHNSNSNGSVAIRQSWNGTTGYNAWRVIDSPNVGGNAATATKLQTARSINGVGFDGTSDITIADNTKLPLTGGTLTGNLITKTSFLAQTIQELGVGDNTPIRVPEIVAPLDVSGYIPFMHGSMLTANMGYRTQISIGGYRGSNKWDNSGAYIAIGGEDTNPVESFRFLHGRRITNSTGPILLEGNATSATRLETQRSIFGLLFDGTNDVSGSITASTGIVKSGNNHYIDMGRDSVDRMNFYNYGGNYNFIDSHNNVTYLSINKDIVSASNLRLSGSVYCSKYKSNSRVWLTDHSEYNAQGMNVGSLFVGDRYAEDIYTPNNGIYAKGIILSESGFHGKLLAKDSRIFKPLNAESGGISAYFVTEVGLNNDHTGGNYGDFLSLNTYNDASAGNQNGLFFDKTGKRIVHYQSAFGAANWGSGKTLAYAEDVLSINGGTMNAPISFNLSSADGAFHKLIQADTTTDGGYIAVGNHGSDRGYLELGTVDDGDAAIYARKRNGANTILDEAVILGPDNNTSFPNSVFIHNAIGGYGKCGLVAGAADDARYDGCNIDITSWFGLGIKSSQNGERTVVFNARTGDISNRGSLHTEQWVNAKGLGVNSTEGTGHGLSLHGGTAGGMPTYGISFAQTQHHGRHGYVDGDWATYFTMEGAYNRGWIFKSHTHGNVASISSQGFLSIPTMKMDRSNFQVVTGSNYTVTYDYATRIAVIEMKVMSALGVGNSASPFKILEGRWTSTFALPITLQKRLSAYFSFEQVGLPGYKLWDAEAGEWLTWCAPVGQRGSTESAVTVDIVRFRGGEGEPIDGFLTVTGFF